MQRRRKSTITRDQLLRALYDYFKDEESTFDEIYIDGSEEQGTLYVCYERLRENRMDICLIKEGKEIDET
tara:strand:+ start:513 stop:722 length:210 start_codon:yes stop_codon:yes gene_type:complete